MIARTAFRLLVAVPLFSFGCRSAPKSDAENPVPAEPKSNELPPLSVKADTPNLLLT